MEPDSIDTWPPGQFTVLNFWSIGCGFCIREIPQNNELSQWLKNKGGRFISIYSATEKPQNVIEYLENIAEWLKEKREHLASGQSAAKRPNVNDYVDSNKIQYAVGLDEPDSQHTYWGSATFAKYGVNSIPCYIILDEDGNVVSYERTVTKQMLEELMKKKPGQITTNNKGKAGQRLDVIPKGWIVGNLEPNSQVQGRFFVFRPETPNPDLHELGSGGNAIDCQWTRHSTDGQTIYEVTLTAKTPDWGQSLKGEVALAAQYGNVEEMVTIPYELRSRSLAECESDVLWLGPATKGETVSKTIALQCDRQRDVKVTAVSVASEIQLNIAESGEGPDRIFVKCAFSSQESGLQQGTVKLLAHDVKGNEQPLHLEYYAYVRP